MPKTNKKTLVRITSPHFVAGVELGGNIAPIVFYMQKWPLEQIQKYCASRGWECEIVDG